jgi:hypothetical protein
MAKKTAEPAHTVVVDIETIVVPRNWRPIDEAVMPALMDSVATIGLLHPVLLAPRMLNKFELVGGRHRLEAHRRLGLKTILGRVLDRQYAGMARPSENAHRASYSELENSEDMIAYRDNRQLWDDEQATPKGGAQPGDRGNSKTARLFGTSTKRVRSAEAHVRICDGAKNILRSNPKVQTVAALDRIASLSATDDQIRAATLLVNGTKAPEAAAKRPQPPAAKPLLPSKLTVLWTMWNKTELSERFRSAEQGVQNGFLARLRGVADGEDWA